jgi:amino acid transporter
MTGLVINGVIGSGIFGVPGELNRMLGRGGPFAMLLGALVMGIIAAAMTEVASQFSEPGGPYLYVRTAFGPFLGIQVGWFWLLSLVSGAAAGTNLFVGYLASFMPSAAHGWPRAVAITVLIAIPSIANYFGVRSGANFTNLFTVAKILPLAFLIIFGLFRFGHQIQIVHPSEVASPGWSPWLSALLLLLFVYGGYEDSLAPLGEVEDPRRTVPFALATGLLICAAVFTLVQVVTVAAIGTVATDRPLVEVAIKLIGHGGAFLVAVAVMISSYGYIVGTILAAPRVVYALSSHGDFPNSLSRLNSRYHTPAIATCIYALLVWLLALTGTFLWVAAVSAGSMALYYGAICAALIQLRKTHPDASALRLPFGRAIALAGIAICIALLSRLSLREALLMCITAVVASGNWWWVRQREIRRPANPIEVSA